MSDRVSVRVANDEDKAAFGALLARTWPLPSIGYHVQVLDRWRTEWPGILSEFLALLVVETPEGRAGYAGIQRHPIVFTGGMDRALGDHFLAPDLPPERALRALLAGVGEWAKAEGFARVTFNLEPAETEMARAIADLGAFPERVAMYTPVFPEEAPDPTVRLATPEEWSAVVTMGARIVEYLSTYPGTLVQLPFNDLMAATETAYREYGATRPHRFFVVERDGRLVGFCFCVVEGGEGGLIYDLYVDPAYRGHGLSRALYVTATRWLKEQGAMWLTLSVFAENTVAIKAYEKWRFFPYFVSWELNLRTPAVPCGARV